MDLEIEEYSIRIAIVHPRSRIDAFSAPQLRDRLEQLLEGGVIRFVINLSSVPFLDSAGMATLVSIMKQARQRGGDVALIWPNDEAACQVLRLTKFDRIFSIHARVEDAIAAM
jgi:anti-sigma B factor antagonist